jgi:hypothetical protein
MKKRRLTYIRNVCMSFRKELISNVNAFIREEIIRSRDDNHLNSFFRYQFDTKQPRLCEIGFTSESTVFL